MFPQHPMMENDQELLETQREVTPEALKTLNHRIKIYAADVVFALNNPTSNFKTLFSEFNDTEVRLAATKAWEDERINEEQREAYRNLFRS